MKVHLIKKQAIEEYVVGHAASKPGFEYWVTAVKFAEWDKPEDIQPTFGTADLLGRGCNRVVFDIAGNNYRMICKYHFGITKVSVFVCWIGTHTE
jgi:mRNA interferase HigB